MPKDTAKVNYDAISQTAAAAESAQQQRALQTTGSDCTCCRLSHAISASNLTLAGQKLDNSLYSVVQIKGQKSCIVRFQ